ncbi:MAG: riboflavin kinase [Candidatus Peribacteraceae bacterium]|nr:riboflavin kinase [Candidatus Peribacteraceae bacterium]
MSHPPSLRFSAPVIKGAGRGRIIGSPTVNLALTSVPAKLPFGIFACGASFDAHTHPAVLHYGPRPVFREGVSCEVHFLDGDIEHAPETLTVTVVKRLRDIRNFPSPEALQKQIAIDVAEARAILTAP